MPSQQNNNLSDLSGSAWEFLENEVEAFETAWTRGERPRIVDYLPENDPTGGQLLIELAHTELELRLKAGEPVSAAEYLAAWPVMDSSDVASALIATELRFRRRNASRTPRDASQIRNTRRPGVTTPHPGPFETQSDQRRTVGTASIWPDAAGSFPEAAPIRPGPESGGSELGVCPDRIGRFRVERILGQGGFGVVYLATDPMLGRKVAIKVPQPHILARAELWERFIREAHIVASLDHPNIVSLYEVGEAGNCGFLVSSYCPGTDLAHWLSAQTGPVPLRFAAELIAVLAEAMQYCHECGVMHRDLKPANIVLDPTNTHGGLPFVPRLTDFGLAKVIETSLTETGNSIVMGTPVYMAPEQAFARGQVGQSADVYSLGVILYELLCGKPPFEGSLASVLSKVRDEQPERPAKLRRDLPRSLENVCLKCLRKIPGHRYSTIGDLAADLRRYLTGDAVSARPRTVFEWLTDWCHHPSRLRDAGMTAILVNSLVIFWMVANHIRTFLGTLFLPRSVDPIESALVSACIIVTMHVPMLIAGIMTLQRRPNAVYVGTLISMALVITAAAIGTGSLPAYGHLYDDGELRSMVFMMLTLLFTAQFVAYIAACASLLLHPERVFENDEVAKSTGGANADILALAPGEVAERMRHNGQYATPGE